MKCSLCEKVALTQAGSKGFCNDHRAESIAITKKIALGIRSQNGADHYRRDDSTNFRLRFDR